MSEPYTQNEFENFSQEAPNTDLRHVGRPTDQGVGGRRQRNQAQGQPRTGDHVHSAPSGRQVRTTNNVPERPTDFQRAHEREIGSRPTVRLARVQLDEAMFGALVRIDETLSYRGLVDDKKILDRIEAVFKSQFQDIG